jgi:hypothetical protein
MNNHLLERKIASDVVKRFVNLKESTARHALLIKFINQPTTDAIRNLVDGRVIRRKGNVATVDEEYLPHAAAFEICDDPQLREQGLFLPRIRRGPHGNRRRPAYRPCGHPRIEGSYAQNTLESVKQPQGHGEDGRRQSPRFNIQAHCGYSTDLPGWARVPLLGKQERIQGRRETRRNRA